MRLWTINRLRRFSRLGVNRIAFCHLRLLDIRMSRLQRSPTSLPCTSAPATRSPAR